MKILYYNSQFESKLVKPKNLDYGDSLTDKVFFRPEIFSIADTKANNAVTGLYDFQDGKDTGERLSMYLRDKSLDITEKVEIVEAYEADINNRSELDKQDLQSLQDKAVTDELKNTLLKNLVSKDKPLDNSPASGTTSSNSV